MQGCKIVVEVILLDNFDLKLPQNYSDRRKIAYEAETDISDIKFTCFTAKIGGSKKRITMDYNYSFLTNMQFVNSAD